MPKADRSNRKVRPIYRTGVEYKPCTAPVCGLRSMIAEPIDKGITLIVPIGETGGKRVWKDKFVNAPKAAVLVCSDQVSSGKKKDTAGAMIKERLEKLNVDVIEIVTVPDDAAPIKDQVQQWCKLGVDLILTTGGTGLSPRDNTPDAIASILDREIPGIMETARAYGQDGRL